ncbi:uncharacterized protein LOC129943179 isoform X2 [Eupeodes corollae]|uniref:uncharacterized protein LOC129943179 isoform X2 n=1 Tax=Eupeodes corollae TaxID=290404 RepID=UPI002491AB3F|nr:uncharacterized protein LOC129943179 isoform X2 [Eupeodes corollae]
MRLNGALRPHGAPGIGRSIGAKKYRDKRPQQQGKADCEPNNTLIAISSCYLSNNNKNNKIITTLPTAATVEAFEAFEAVKAAEAATAAVAVIVNNNNHNFKRTQGNSNPSSTDKPDVFINKQPYTIFKRSSVTRATNNMASSGTGTGIGIGRSQGRRINATATSGRKRGVAPDDDVAVNVAFATTAATAATKRHQRHHPMRVPQSLLASLSSLSTLVLCLVYICVLLPSHVICDDDNGFFVNTFSMGPETTTPEFDYVSRGKKKFGDKCENTLECGFPGSICDPKKKSCQCVEELPVTNHIDKCGKEAAVNESCFFNEQCESTNFQTECRDGRCVCRFEMVPILNKDGVFECTAGTNNKHRDETYIDPAMIGVLVGMALMFIIICVVLRLFSQARWRENRTIFNTPNPRLMNVSLLRDSKLLHGQERRGSRMSVRAPSRQPSMASLRPHSPNPSLGRMTRSKSNTRSSDSRTSDASNCSKLLLEHSHSHSHSHSHNSHTHTVPSTSTNAAAAAATAASTGLISPGSISPACGSAGAGAGGGGATALSTSPVIGLNQARTNKF